MKSHLVNPERPRRGAGVEVMWRNLPFNNFHFSKVCNSHVSTNDVSQTLKSVGNYSHPSYDCSSPVLWGWRTCVNIPSFWWTFLHHLNHCHQLYQLYQVYLCQDSFSLMDCLNYWMFDWNSPGRVWTLAPWASRGSAICEPNVSENLQRF